MRMRMLSVGWMAMLATAGVAVGAAQASAAPEGGTVASPARTIEWSASHATPDVGTAPRQAVMAQSQITAGPLQGPLSAREADRPGARCPVPVRRVVQRRRMARRTPPPVLVTALPLVPFVPAYAYPPPGMYRPVVPVYAFQPFYRPYFYRPYFYRPHFYRGFY